MNGCTFTFTTFFHPVSSHDRNVPGEMDVSPIIPPRFSLQPYIILMPAHEGEWEEVVGLIIRGRHWDVAINHDRTVTA
jgi:hypothetical protein